MPLSETYKENLRIGNLYEDFCANVLFYLIKIPLTSMKSKHYQLEIGENLQGLEIKYQGRMEEYKSLYIETHEKSHKDNENFVKSGIYRKDNTWLWMTGDWDVAFLIPLNKLKMLYETGEMRTLDSETSKGFVLPLDLAEKYCIKKFDNLKVRFKKFLPPEELIQKNKGEDDEGNIDKV